MTRYAIRVLARDITEPDAQTWLKAVRENGTAYSFGGADLEKSNSRRYKDLYWVIAWLESNERVAVQFLDDIVQLANHFAVGPIRWVLICNGNRIYSMGIDTDGYSHKWNPDKYRIRAWWRDAEARRG